MVGREILLCDHRCFPVLIQLGNLFLRHGLDDHVGGRRCRGSLPLCTSCSLGARGGSVASDEGGLVSLTSHCGMGSGVMQRVVNKKQKTLRQEGEMMGHGVHSGVQLYMCGR
jgi:hypothetical protein